MDSIHPAKGYVEVKLLVTVSLILFRNRLLADVIC